MFKLHLPCNITTCSEHENNKVHESEFSMQADDKLRPLWTNECNVTRPEIHAQHTENDTEDKIYKAAQKFIQYIEKRETIVTYHGPNACSDKKPWAVYTHFHVTVIANHRPGSDTTYANLTALHRKVATCNIPASQITRFPASWANYLTQYRRIQWYSGTDNLTEEFASWTLRPYIDRNVPLPVNRKRLFEEAKKTNTTEDNPDDALLHMKNGKVQRLYDYLSWQVKEHDYATREDLVDGALSHGTGENFSRALIHPHFDNILNKVFTMDRATEINTPFRVQLEKINWEKYDQTKYLDKDVSLKLIKEILNAQGISLIEFTTDVYELLTLAKPKTNLLCLEGVPNSGKSYIARSIASLYKYQNTCQGTTSFPFMDMANASIALIEEPVFSSDNLQTFKKLAEGTPTDVAVKNRKAARVPRIPIIITSNYNFIVQGGSTEKTAFNTRMKKYLFKTACGFLKMAKKMLNPGIWKDLFTTLLPDEVDGESSDDNELREFLNMNNKETTTTDEDELALMCSEPMFDD